MIYVKRDPALIPTKLIEVAERAQATLETLPSDERRAFIKKKSHIWRAFSRYLRQMSYRKCWYSESNDPQSFFDVDHFRPKLEAKRSETDSDTPGYEWLAFSWENFRYSAAKSNRLSTDDDTEKVVGKGSWFPLLVGSPTACWDDRCENTERPLLIDPLNRDDVRLLTVNQDGRIIPRNTTVGTQRDRVIKSCEIYGLNLPHVTEARLQLMRDIKLSLSNLQSVVATANLDDATMPLADSLPVDSMLDQIRQKTKPENPFSCAARAAVTDAGYSELCIHSELY